MNRNMTRRAFAGTLGAGTMAVLAGCGGGQSATTDSGSAAANTPGSAQTDMPETPVIRMVTDTGGVNDQSFNELSWAGMQQLEEEYGWDVAYLESKQDSDYATNLESCVDDDANLIWGIGYNMNGAVLEAAETNEDVQFAIIDSTYENPPANLTGVDFMAEQCSFAVGYIAARVSKSGKVGFVGGMNSDTMQHFEQGYYAGIEYANAATGTSVEYQGQWTDSFNDAAKGNATAQKMIADGCDVLFHAAGNVGTGMIEACVEADIWAIGVDQDQAHLAPENVISSALKRVDQAIVEISTQLVSGERTGGENITLGVAQDAVGIAPTHDVLDTIAPGLYEETLAVLDLIKDGDIEVPYTAEDLEAFKEWLVTDLDAEVEEAAE